MDFKEIIESLYTTLLTYTPLFRMIWVSEIIIGAALIVIALILNRNPERKKLPIVLGVIGALMALSASAQLITSIF